MPYFPLSGLNVEVKSQILYSLCVDVCNGENVCLLIFPCKWHEIGGVYVLSPSYLLG